MKSYIDTQQIPELVGFPKIMTWNGAEPDDGFVVLFLDQYRNNVVLATGKDQHYKVGDMENMFNIDEFKPFIGSISISN